MSSFALVLAAYVLLAAVAIACDRWTRLESRLSAARPGGSRDLVLRAIDPTTVPRTADSDDVQLLLALGWLCARAGRRGGETVRLLLWTAARLRVEPRLAPPHVTAGIVAYLGGLLAEAGETGEHAIRVYRWCLLVRPRLDVFVALLKALHQRGDPADVVAVWGQHPRLARSVRAGARSDAGAADVDPRALLQSLEIACLAHERAGALDPAAWEDDALFLLEHTSGEVLSRVGAAHALLSDAGKLRDPQAAVRAVERLVPPHSRNDYSNFHAVFSLRGWRLVRDLLEQPRLRIELERFVAKHDRHAFGRAFEEGFGS